MSEIVLKMNLVTHWEEYWKNGLVYYKTVVLNVSQISRFFVGKVCDFFFSNS